MAKRYDDPIEVTADPSDPGAPIAFRWRGRLYDIDQRMTTWREAGEWWNGRAGMRENEFYRVLARPASARATGEVDPDGYMRTLSGVYDICRDRISGAWRLARIWD